MKDAGICRRGLALMIDYLIMSAHFFPATYMVKGTWMMGRSDHIWSGIFDPICAVFLVIIIAYFVLFEAFMSSTPGKALLNMRVCNASGNPISFKQSLIRFGGRMVDGIGANLLGAIIMMNNSRHQRLGDKWAGTFVVMRRDSNYPSKVKES